MKTPTLSLSLALLAMPPSFARGENFEVTPYNGSPSKFWSQPSTWVGDPADAPSNAADHVTFSSGINAVHLRVDQEVTSVGSITHTGTGSASNRITAQTGINAHLAIENLIQNSSAVLHLANKTTSSDTGTLQITIGNLTVANGATLEIGRSTLGSLEGFSVTSSSQIAGTLHYNGVQNEAVEQDRIHLGNTTITGAITFGAIASANDAHRVISFTTLSGTADGYIALNTIGSATANPPQPASKVSGTLEIHSPEGTTSTYAGRFRMSTKTSVSDATLSLHKRGTGTQIFTHNGSDYNGGTFIHEGILAVANPTGGSTYSLGMGAVNVENGGTLAGSGFLRQSDVITVKTGGRLYASAHLADEVTTLTISGADRALGEVILEVEAGATLGFRFGAAGTNDTLAFTAYKSGGLLLDSDGIMVDAVGLEAGSYTLMTFSSIATAELENLASLLRMGNGFNGYTATFYNAPNAIMMEVEAIPEPSGAALGALGVVGLTLWRRMNR